MKYLLWAIVLYEASVGVSELLWVKTGNQTLTKLASLPSVASLGDSYFTAQLPEGANLMEGAIDLGVAAIVLYTFILD